MMDYELPVRGIVTGLIIAAPVGPVNVLCIQRTLGKGWRSGLLSGFGAAAADTIYGAIAGFGITLVIDFLLKEQFWIRVLGGLVLIAIGVIYYHRKPLPLKEQEEESTHSDFVSTFLLTLTNPTTILSFIAVLATLGMREHRTVPMTLLLVAGIFCGSMAWWVLLTGVVNRLRRNINNNTMCWMNRIAGIAIGGFGVVNIILGMLPKK
ncbi:MAG TPA: LysE family translocator [Candidatus Sulfopaludibacter sp.]|jgi:threonine/homoserine/homoserine lactone efflux protein|nr:LysE family translocator [Candidatus Sulfopaludibacter sp.]